MSATKNKVLTIIVLALVAIGGFIFGRSHLEQPQEKESLTESKLVRDEQHSDYKKQPPDSLEKTIEYNYLDETSFLAATPNIGPLITTVPAMLDADNQIVRFKNNTPQAKHVNKGNNVILYNQDGSVHLREVRIGFIGQSDAQGQIVAGLDFDGALDKKVLGDRATIISKETFAVKRLPLSAVVVDKENGEFLWVITPLDKNKEPTIFASANNLLVNKKRVNTEINDYRFFEVPNSILTTQLVILNPSDALKENTILPTVSIVGLDAPQGTMLFEARMKASIESAQADIALSFEQAEQCVANAEAVVATIPIPEQGDITGRQSTRAQANELPQTDDAGSCGGSPSAGSCGGDDSTGSCGGGDSAGSCGGGDSAGSCGGSAPSACGADPYLSDFNSEPPAQMIDPYVLLGIEPLSK